MAAELIQPRGPARDDVRALFMAGAAMAAMDPRHGPKAKDFFAHLFRGEKPQSVEDMMAVCKMLAGVE